MVGEIAREMTWEDKLRALQCLCEITIRMRKPGDWFVNPRGRYVQQNGSMIQSGAYGEGRTPQEAIENDWLKMTTLPEDHYIVVGTRSYRWNGYMWQDYSEGR